VTRVLELAVVIATLSAGGSNFEKLVLALLILIYLRSYSIEFYSHKLKGMLVNQNTYFVRLSEVLNDPESEKIREAATEAEQDFYRVAPDARIELIFNIVAQIAAIWVIVMLLF